MLSNIKEHKFVFTLKPKLNIKLEEKYEEPKQIMSYDMLNYIATFIDVLDTFTLISYLMAFPFSIYEIKKKFIEYYKIETPIHEIAPSCLYKFINEPVRILNDTLIPLFGTYGLLNYCTQDHKKILTRENGRRFVIHLIKEQNKAPSREIYRILNEIECPPKTMHHTFPILDILYNSQIALLSRYVKFSEIDNYIYKKLKSYYTFNDIKLLNTNERALLMFHYDVDDNFNSKFIGKESLRHNLIVEALKLNYFKIIDILFENKFENKLISIYNPNCQYTEVELYICNLKINSDEFNKSRNIIKYYLERLINFYTYEETICNMINYSFSINNIEMIKFLMSLNDARKGISMLLCDSLIYKNNQIYLRNNRDSTKEELDKYKAYTSIVFEQCDYILYDFLINNLPNGIDIKIIIQNMVCNDSKLYCRYIYIIEKYVENFDNKDACNNPKDKYYCDRNTLINMYKLLLNPYYYNNLINILKEEFEELLNKEEFNQPSDEMLREYIKKLYYKTKIRRIQVSNMLTLLIAAKNDNVTLLEKHKNFGILFEYITKIPEFLIDNIKIKNVVISKMNEFLDAKLDENYIETAYFMTNIRKISEIIKNIDGELIP
jgi:hypothetical protein